MDSLIDTLTTNGNNHKKIFQELSKSTEQLWILLVKTKPIKSQFFFLSQIYKCLGKQGPKNTKNLKN